MTRTKSIPRTIILQIPFRLVKRGGRKELHLPDGAAHPQRTDSTLIKALARAFRWKRVLESGDFATTTDLARHEGIAPSYLTRILRLTFLAPDIIEAILEGQAMSMTAEVLRTGIDDDWDAQRRTAVRSQ
jgi:hypothetical protein